jgi:hypothetical protein
MEELYQEKYNKSFNKYTYTINECENDLFIFELNLKTNDQKNNKLRFIKNTRNGKLISSNDNLMYNNIKKISIIAFDVNNPVKQIKLDCILNQVNKQTMVLNNNMYVEFYENNGFLESNYNLIDI